MSGITDVIRHTRLAEGTTRQFWQMFEAYLDRVRAQRSESGEIAQNLLPTAYAWTGYFMALAADPSCNFQKLYRAVRVAEQEFGAALNAHAYMNVLRGLSEHGSEPGARFALKILEGFRSQGDAPKKALNFGVMACMRAGLLEDAFKLLREIRELHPKLLEADLHVMRTHEAVLHACRGHPEHLDDALELATFMKQKCNWLLSPALIGPLVGTALEQRREPGLLLELLSCVVIPATERFRYNAPFLEEGLLLCVMAVAARAGHVDLALKAWDLMEYCLLPIQPVSSSPTTAAAPDAKHEEGNEEASRHERNREAQQDPRYEMQSRYASAGEDVEDEEEDLLDPEALLPCHVPSIVAYQSLIDTFVNAKQLRQAFRMVWQLQQVHPNRPDAVAFENALMSIVDAAAESGEAVDDAYFVLEDMQKQGEQVSNPMLDCVTAACSQMGDLSRMIETFDAYTKQFGLKPDAQAFNAVLMGCIQHQRALVPRILADMKERKVPFNALTYSLLVEFHAAKGDAQAAVDALHEAQAAGIEIRNTSFEKLISRCERSGERQMMVELLKQRWEGKNFKDTNVDLQRLLRWRWRDLGGMEALTGSPNFVIRPSLKGVPPES